MARYLFLFFLIPFPVASATPYNLDNCEEDRCKCVVDSALKDHIRPCQQVLDSLKSYQVTSISPVNKTLVISGSRVNELPRSVFQGLKVRQLFLKDVPNLAKAGPYVFWSAKLDAIDMAITNAYLDVIPDNIFQGWMRFTNELDCSSWSGFTDWQKGSCYYLSIVVDPGLKQNMRKSVRLERHALKGTYWVKGLRLGGLLNPYDGSFLKPYGENLTHLKLSGNVLAKLEPQSLKTLTHLTSLVISKKHLQNVSRVGENHIGFWFRNKPDLTHIGIEGGFEIRDGNWAEDILAPEKITVISLRGNTFPNGLPKLLGRFRNLEKLDLSETHLTNGGNLRDFKNDFYRLQEVILPKSSQRFCDCEEFEWMRDWPPFQQTEANVLLDADSYLLPIVLQGSKMGDLHSCLDWCEKNRGDVTGIPWNILLLSALALLAAIY